MAATFLAIPFVLMITRKLWDKSGNQLVTFSAILILRTARCSVDGNYILTASRRQWPDCGTRVASHSSSSPAIPGGEQRGVPVMATTSSPALRMMIPPSCIGTRVATARHLSGHTSYVTQRGVRSGWRLHRCAGTMIRGIVGQEWQTTLATSTTILDRVYSAVFNPDGSYVLTARRPHRQVVGQSNRRHPQRPYWTKLYGAVFSPDGNTILAASGDGTARFGWDKSGKPLALSSRYCM